MTSAQQIEQHPASVDMYIRHGWSLVAIPPGTKGPRTTGWNTPEGALKSQTDLPYGHGIGLAHAYSGTMALDIDNWDSAITELLLHGINLKQLYDDQDAVIIDSGRHGHGKLIYSMPPGLVLPSKKIKINNTTIYELRCGTADGLTVQDVLPPSIHPDTHQPYRWAGRGHWSMLPPLPLSILTLWQSLINDQPEPALESVLPVLPIATSYDEIESALAAISPDVSHDDWLNVGMALHWYASQTNSLDYAFSVWDNWSKGSAAKYPGEHQLAIRWRSFKATRSSAITLGTLFQLARHSGWVRTDPDVSKLFDPVGGILTEPAKIHAALRPQPPEVDLSLWPMALSTRATEVSNQVGCDPMVPLLAGLAAVCAAIDARTRLELMEGFQVPPVLWLMTIGEPADKKSPGSRPMMSILKQLELEDRPRFVKEFLEWEGKEATHASSKKAFLEFAANPTSILNADQAPTVSELPPEPVPLRLTVSDITSQKLVRAAAERPRGLLCYLDEMNNWVRKITDKTSSEDRSAWVVSYESEHYEMDRVGAGRIFAENLAVSIYGNIQPRVFREAMGALSADGMLQRFIPVILNPKWTRLGQPVPDWMTHRAQWEQTIRLIYALPPITYTLSPEAFNEFRGFQRWYEDTKRDERLLQSDPIYMTAFGKLEGLTGRLILLHHVIEAPFNPVVSLDTVKRVIRLVISFVIPSYRYALSEIGGATSFDGWVTDHIIQRCDQAVITIQDIRRSGQHYLKNMTLYQVEEMIIGAMYVLSEAGWVARVDDPMTSPSKLAHWAINPALRTQFQEYRAAVTVAKQRRIDSFRSQLTYYDYLDQFESESGGNNDA